MTTAIKRLEEEFGVEERAAQAALSKRHNIELYAREYLEVNRKIKAGKLTGVMPDSELFPLWGEYLKKQNG